MTIVQPIEAEAGLHANLMDISGLPPLGPDFWPPLKVSAREIEEAVHRLTDAERPANGVRASSIVHPFAVEPGLGFSPGIDITINVLLPGEATQPIRRNASAIEICIRGRGQVTVDGDSFPLVMWDVCNLPSMQTYFHANDGDEPWVRLTYSNAPLLGKLGVNYFELDPARHSRTEGGTAPTAQSQRYDRGSSPDILVADSGARIRGYEYFSDIEVVESRAHRWPFERINAELSQIWGDNKRNLMILFNPATERRNGANHSFVVAASSIPAAPAGAPTRPIGRGHRHSSVAINYHFKGSGKSVVNGELIEWNAGDLLLSAPGWSEHAHYIGAEGAAIFTVQDHPLHIGMESLILQEDMDGPILTLGSEVGQTGYVGPRKPGD